MFGSGKETLIISSEEISDIMKTKIFWKKSGSWIRLI